MKRRHLKALLKYGGEAFCTLRLLTSGRSALADTGAADSQLVGAPAPCARLTIPVGHPDRQVDGFGRHLIHFAGNAHSSLDG